MGSLLARRSMCVQYRTARFPSAVEVRIPLSPASPGPHGRIVFQRAGAAEHDRCTNDAGSSSTAAMSAWTRSCCHWMTILIAAAADREAIWVKWPCGPGTEGDASHSWEAFEGGREPSNVGWMDTYTTYGAE